LAVSALLLVVRAAVMNSAVVQSVGLAEVPASGAQTASALALARLAVGVEFAPEQRQLWRQ